MSEVFPEEPDGVTEGEYGLVMPFIITREAGGEYDDEAFVAGYWCGSLDSELSWLSSVPQGAPALPSERMIPAGVLPQVDLLAMRYGYTIVSTVSEDANWVSVRFEYGEIDDE